VRVGADARAVRVAEVGERARDRVRREELRRERRVEQRRVLDERADLPEEGDGLLAQLLRVADVAEGQRGEGQRAAVAAAAATAAAAAAAAAAGS
jgi:hypothetical protein